MIASIITVWLLWLPRWLNLTKTCTGETAPVIRWLIHALLLSGGADSKIFFVDYVELIV